MPGQVVDHKREEAEQERPWSRWSRDWGDASFPAQDSVDRGRTRGSSIASPVAQSFATLARALRERGHDAQAVTHFVNQLVFCMFADDVGLLPGQMFTRMLEQARRAPTLFVDQAGELFR